MLIKSKDDGFTLIEVTTVLLILGILVLISIPVFLSVRERTYDTQARVNIRNGIVFAKEFYTLKQSYVSMNSAELKEFTKSIPLQDIGSDCRNNPPGSNAIHAILYVQTGLVDGSACIGVWSKGSDERYTWTVSTKDVEVLDLR